MATICGRYVPSVVSALCKLSKLVLTTSGITIIPCFLGEKTIAFWRIINLPVRWCLFLN